MTFVYQEAAILEEKSNMIGEQSATIKLLLAIAESQSNLIHQMRKGYGHQIQMA